MGKLSVEQRAEIARRAESESKTKLAEEFGVSRQTIYRTADEFEANKVSLQNAFGEFGVTGLSRFGGSVMEDYDTEWQSLSRMVKLVKEMLDWPIVGSMAFAIEMSLRKAEWTATPASEEKADVEAAEFLDSCINDMSQTWDDHITQAVSMLWFGFAPFEMVFKRRLGMDKEPDSKYDDGRIGWRKFAFRAQDSLAPGNEWIFDENGGIQGMNQQAPPFWRQVTIPIEKLILYRTSAAKNNPQGKSALRAAHIPWYFAKNLSEIEGISAERLGTGFPIMYLGDGTRKEGTNSDLAFAKQAVRDIRADEQGGLVVPYPKMTNDGRGALFEFMSPPSRGIIDFDRAIMRYNQQIAQTLLAQFIFLGMAQVGTQALASNLTDFFANAVSGWLKTIAETINRHAVPRLFRLNAWTGLTGYPELNVGDIGEINIEALFGAIQSAVGSGVLEPDEGTERVVRQRLGLPERDSPEGGVLLRETKPQPEPQIPELDENVDEEDVIAEEAMRVSELERLASMAEEALELLRHG